MHIHKPNDTMLLLGYACRAGRPALTVTVGYVCAADGARVSEQDAWKWLAPLFPDEPFDLGEKKSRGGFGVAGDACAPAGTSVDGLTVRAGVGTLERRVLVQADRTWTKAAAGWRAVAGGPFQRMPIGLARAYGGAAWADNPFGRGHTPKDGSSEGLPLPNVELPEQPVLKPTDTPGTATLGPHPLGSRARTQWLGALDKAWERDRLPWLPDDTDPRWFDRFDPSQCQPGYWAGDEPWFVENMHPTRGTVRGKLPGLRPRLLLRTVAEPDRHAELALDLDTVWLMPNDERVIVLYRAQTAVVREDARDVLGLGVFTETMADAPHSLEYWSQIWRQALERKKKAAPMPAPAPLDPKASAALQASRQQARKKADEFKAALEKDIDQKLKAAETQAEAQLRAAGVNVEEMKAHAAKAGALDLGVPSDVALPREPKAYAAALKAHIEGNLKQAEERAMAQLRKQGVDVDAVRAHALAHQGAKPDVVAAMKKMVAQMGLPAAQGGAYIAELEAFQKEMKGLGATIQARFQQAGQAAADAEAARHDYDDRAALDGLPQGPRDKLTRDMLLDRVQSGASTAWVELDGLDLSGLDLTQVNLRQSILRNCNLHGTVLSAADLTEAEITGCNLGAARLDQACLQRAQLERNNLHEAQLAHADFSSARLKQCILDQAMLEACRWDNARLEQCSFDAAVLKGASGKRAVFLQCRLPHVDASACRFEKTRFNHCSLDRVVFAGGTLQGCTFMACQAGHADFRGAALPGLRTLQDTRLDHANLQGADMRGARLQGTSLAHAVLRETQLDNALVSGCDLANTDAWRMTARRASFADSHIAQASWRGANLMRATFRQARLVDTDLSGANLHAAQTRTATVQGLRLDGALMTRCRLLQEYGDA